MKNTQHFLRTIICLVFFVAGIYLIANSQTPTPTTSPETKATPQASPTPVQVPPEISGIVGEISKELQNAQRLLMEGQKLMAASKADSLSAREKLNQALTLFRSLNVKVKDKNLLAKVAESGKTANESLNVLKILEFYSMSGKALSLNGIAQTHTNLGERQKSVDFMKLAIGVYQEIISDKTFPQISGINVKETISILKFNHASALVNLGQDLDEHFGKSEEALKYLHQALEALAVVYKETPKPEFKSYEAVVLKSIGSIYGRDSKNSHKAIEYFTKALEIYRSLPDEDEEVAGTLSSIALQQSLNYDYKSALHNWEKALDIYRRIDYKQGQSSILRQIGLMYWVLSDKPRVAEYVNQILTILQSADFKESWKKRLNTKGFGIYDELYDNFIEHTRLETIANAYRLLEDYQKSLEHYEKALVVSLTMKQPRTIRHDLRSIAYSFAKLEKWDKAAEFYKRALEISRQHGVKEDISDDVQDVGWALLEEGKPKEALTYEYEALSIYQSVGIDESKAFSVSYSNLLNEISRSHYALGNKRLAIFYGKRAVNAMQVERQRLQNLDPVSQKGFLGKKEKHYRRLADWLIEEHRIIEAEQVLAMLKDEEVSSYLRRDVSEVDKLQKRADLKPEERDALTRYNKIGERITAIGTEYDKLREFQRQGLKLTDEQQKRYDELKKQVEDANNIFQAFLKQLADEFAKRKITKEGIEEDLALQSQLKEWGEGVVFLYTLVGEDRYRVILTTPKIKTDGKYEIKSVDLDEKISEFRLIVQNPKLDPRPLGKELYDILIKPIEKQLEGAKAKTLIWSLDGNLRLLPVAALWDGKEYFGQKYQNVVFTVASRSRLNETSSPDWRVLGLGVSESKTVSVKELDGTTRSIPFEGLPAVKKELTKIVAYENSEGVLPGFILLNSDFNKKNFVDQLIKGYKAVHIASHFDLNAGDATKSFLLLGDGNALTVSEIKTNPDVDFAGVDLLTLSACQTAVVEKDSNGKEIEGFGYIAQQKGAKAILATLWSVADESTAVLMSEFYRLRKTNPKLTKAEAMQLAQRAMVEGRLKPLTEEGQERAKIVGVAEGKTNAPPFALDKSKPYEHPYFWSPFILIGNWK